MILILALSFAIQPPDGPGFGGANLDMDRLIESAVRIRDEQRSAPVAMGPWTPAVGAPLAELRFMSAVEEFAAAVPPEPYREMIDALGHAEWRARDAATRKLDAALRANPGVARWLFWGRRRPDPEVRLRSNAILRRLNPCPTCKGAGQSKNWELYPCWDCQGTGTTWPYSMWD